MRGAWSSLRGLCAHLYAIQVTNVMEQQGRLRAAFKVDRIAVAAANNQRQAAGGTVSSQRTVRTFLTTESFCPTSVILAGLQGGEEARAVLEWVAPAPTQRRLDWDARCELLWCAEPRACSRSR